jgi:hypothetical protein
MIVGAQVFAAGGLFLGMSNIPTEIEALRTLASTHRVDEYVEFLSVGALVTGVFACVACGRSVVSLYQLPPCPSCGGTIWEDPATSPFGQFRW